MAMFKKDGVYWTQESVTFYGSTVACLNEEVQKLKTKFPEVEEFYIDYEYSYGDSVQLVLQFQRHMTEEEIQKKERREAQQRKLLEENERRQYRNLKKKFGD